MINIKDELNKTAINIIMKIHKAQQMSEKRYAISTVGRVFRRKISTIDGKTVIRYLIFKK